MGIKIKNLQTGEFEKFNIPALKGEKGEPGEIEPSEKVDYIGKQHSKLRDTMNANVDYIIKTAIGEFNYLDYEGQHITATNSIEGHAKSTILKGNTLVNLIENAKAYAVGSGGSSNRKITKTNNSIKVEVVDTSVSCVVVFDTHFQLKPNTKYTITFDSSTTGFEDKMAIGFHSKEGNYAVATKSVTTNNGKNKIVLSSLPNFEIVGITVGRHGAVPVGSTIQISNMIVLEGEYTDQDIPYFTGMTSCKMPVLTTVGKNLFKPFRTYTTKGLTFTITDGQLYVDGTATDTVDYYLTTKGSDGGMYDFINNNIPVGTTLTLSNNLGLRNHFGYYLDGVEKDYWANENLVIKSNTSNIRCFVRFPTGQSFSNQPLNIQLEQGTVATSYEPYKTNILTVNDDITLRGIGDVTDTLDCLTGEVVERIGEIVLDGSDDENWSFNKSLGNGSYNQFVSHRAIDAKKVAQQTVLCDKLNSVATETKNNVIWIYNGTTMVIQSSYASVDELKQYLQSNPITVQYQLKTPTIKTVDLSDNHVYSYGSTTHYSCSSEEGSLVPTLSVKVPTDTQLTIQEQKATTQTLLIKNMDLQQSIKEVQAMNLAFNTALYNSFNSIREEVEDIKKHVSTNENLEGSF